MPEEDRGRENYTMTGWLVNLDRSSPISRHLSICNEAKDSATYVRDVDLKAWAEIPGKYKKRSNLAVLQHSKQQSSRWFTALDCPLQQNISKRFCATFYASSLISSRTKTRKALDNFPMLIRPHWHFESIAWRKKKNFFFATRTNSMLSTKKCFCNQKLTTVFPRK